MKIRNKLNTAKIGLLVLFGTACSSSTVYNYSEEKENLVIEFVDRPGDRNDEFFFKENQSNQWKRGGTVVHLFEVFNKDSVDRAVEAYFDYGTIPTLESLR